MIYRYSETFRRAFLALDVDRQAEVLLALRQFRANLPMPTCTDDDIWHLPLRQHGHLTYSYLTNAQDSHVVCVLRNVGFSDSVN